MRATTAVIEPLLELKFGQVGIANLRLNHNDPLALREEIEQKVAAAPQLFGRAPVVLDLSRLPALPTASEAQALLDAIRTAGMLPVALSYSTAENEALAKELNLPLLAKFRATYERANAAEEAAPAPSKPRPVAAAKATPPAAPLPAAVAAAQSNMRHAGAVRSGQQVYARGRDLIVNAPVANGAEVIADGSIQPELVSIAGRYRVFEEIPTDLRGKPVQAWLDGEKLLIEAIAN
jgi:septum site-determining protein MinC